MTRIRRGIILVLAAFLLGAGGYIVYILYITNGFDFVVRGKVYRSAQPDKETMTRWVVKYGIKTIVNLRAGITDDPNDPVALAAEKAGAMTIFICLPNTKLPKSPNLMYLADVIETAPEPILLHCREGADRTGLASAMAAMALGGKSYDRAREQMGIRHLHLYTDSTRIGGVLLQYEDYCRARGSGTGGWKEFRHWIFNVYLPTYRYVRMDVLPQWTAQPGETTRMQVRITNHSSRVIPAGDPAKRFALLVTANRSFHGDAAEMFCPPVPLPRADIPPGDSVTVDLVLKAPAAAGRSLLLFDIVEDGTTTFSEEGSPLATCNLVVVPAQ
ncbi:MAG TPA: tyrosine-protein phosphatase [Phycisphaerae bacterium]|nr:tyrosine-protein phosphatase [Phycisphaerae bacterium]